MQRLFALICLAPLLTAGVRLQTGADSILLDPVTKPAPFATSLPAAMELTTPTVIFVNPTEEAASPTYPQPVQATAEISTTRAAPAVSATQPPIDPTRMTELEARLCDHALLATTELTLQSYGDDSRREILRLGLAATAARVEVQAQTWPVLKAFETLRRAFPLTAPHRAEVLAAAAAASRLCTNPHPAPARGPVPGSRLYIPRPE